MDWKTLKAQVEVYNYVGDVNFWKKFKSELAEC